MKWKLNAIAAAIICAGGYALLSTTPLRGDQPTYGHCYPWLGGLQHLFAGAGSGSECRVCGDFDGGCHANTEDGDCTVHSNAGCPS